MQTSYSQTPEPAFAGMFSDIRVKVSETFAAEAAIAFGAGCVTGTDPEKQVKLPQKEVATLTFSADFVALNSVAVSVNGVAITPVVFASTHAATLAAVVAAIAGLDGVTASNPSGRIITITAANTDIAVIAAVTLGATQATNTITYATDGVFAGIAIHQHNETGNYTITDAVDTARRGELWVPVTVAVTYNETAYVIAGGADSGSWTNSATGNIATGGKFKSTTSGAGISKVEINLP